jgi:hypothetical protein
MPRHGEDVVITIFMGLLFGLFFLGMGLVAMGSYASTMNKAKELGYYGGPMRVAGYEIYCQNTSSLHFCKAILNLEWGSSWGCGDGEFANQWCSYRLPMTCNTSYNNGPDWVKACLVSKYGSNILYLDNDKDDDDQMDKSFDADVAPWDDEYNGWPTSDEMPGTCADCGYSGASMHHTEGKRQYAMIMMTYGSIKLTHAFFEYLRYRWTLSTKAEGAENALLDA